MELRLLDLRTYDKTMIIKTVQYWPRISNYLGGTGESRSRSTQNTVNSFWKIGAIQ